MFEWSQLFSVLSAVGMYHKNLKMLKAQLWNHLGHEENLRCLLVDEASDGGGLDDWIQLSCGDRVGGRWTKSCFATWAENFELD